MMTGKCEGKVEEDDKHTYFNIQIHTYRSTLNVLGLSVSCLSVSLFRLLCFPVHPVQIRPPLE
jgi:hypothetical protein